MDCLADGVVHALDEVLAGNADTQAFEVAAERFGDRRHGDLGRSGPGRRMRERGEGAAVGPSFQRIVRDSLDHEQGAEIGIAKAERPVVV